MSMDWGYICRDCGKMSDVDLNHAEQELSTLVHHFDALRPLLGLGILQIRSYGYDIIEFLEEHHGHDIALTNECGHICDLLNKSALAHTVGDVVE